MTHAHWYYNRNIWLVGKDSDCDVQVNDDYVSGHHCLVTRIGDTYSITDLGSTNGTWIRKSNGKDVRARQATPIEPGDILIVGRSQIPWSRIQ